MPETDRPTVPNEACVHRNTHHHGTLYSYQKDLCRCDDCRDASRRYQRARRREPDPSPLQEEGGSLHHFDFREELPAWHLDAACRGMDPNVFFPTRGESSRRAREACARCPVEAECLNHALNMAEADCHGIWAGTSVRERREMRKDTTLQPVVKRRICKQCRIEKPLEDFPHSGAGYRRHECKECWATAKTPPPGSVPLVRVHTAPKYLDEEV